MKTFPNVQQDLPATSLNLFILTANEGYFFEAYLFVLHSFLYLMNEVFSFLSWPGQ